MDRQKFIKLKAQLSDMKSDADENDLKTLEHY